MSKKPNGTYYGPDPIPNVDEAQARYWNGYPQRREIADQFEKVGAVIIELVQTVHGNPDLHQDGIMAVIAKLDATLSFIVSKLTGVLGVDEPALIAEFQAWHAMKAAQFEATVKKAQADAEMAKVNENDPKVTLN